MLPKLSDTDFKALSPGGQDVIVTQLKILVGACLIATLTLVAALGSMALLLVVMLGAK